MTDITEDQKRAMKIRASEAMIARAERAKQAGQCVSYTIFADEKDPAIVTHILFQKGIPIADFMRDEP